MKFFLIFASLLLIPFALYAAGNPEPFPTNNQQYFSQGGVNKAYFGKLISLEGKILRMAPGPQNKPMYQIGMPTPVLRNVWVASLTKPEEGKFEVGQIIRVMGYLQSVSNDDTWTKSVTSDEFHVLGFCFLNANTLQASYLPAGIKQCEGWQSGKQPSELM